MPNLAGPFKANRQPWTTCFAQCKFAFVDKAAGFGKCSTFVYDSRADTYAHSHLASMPFTAHAWKLVQDVLPVELSPAGTHRDRIPSLLGWHIRLLCTRLHAGHLQYCRVLLCMHHHASVVPLRSSGLH